MVQSVQSLPSISQAQPMMPIAAQTVTPRQGYQYSLDMALSEPPSSLNSFRWASLKNWVSHPLDTPLATWRIWKSPNTKESTRERMAWYTALQDVLSPQGRKYLSQQLASGRLLDTNADDGRSTLAHLYSILKLPRAEGFSSTLILEETLRHLAEPETVTQKFGVLSDNTIQKLMAYYRSGAGPKVKDAIDIDQLRNTFSAVCPAASQMVDILGPKRTGGITLGAPSEFVRQIDGLTSPRLSFWKKTWHADISPDNPAKAAEKLREFGIAGVAVPGTNGAQYYVQVKLPYSGYLRALNQQGRTDLNVRSVVESAYQDALICLVEPSYDPGLGMLVKEDGKLAQFDGLIAEQTSMLESIVTKAKTSVPFQFILGEPPSLMGYYRRFQQTADDIVTALRDYKTNVLVGAVDTEQTGNQIGSLTVKHEFTIIDYEQDAKQGLVFTVVDTDDDNPRTVKIPARTLIPKIHHAVLPAQLAQKITNQINAAPQNQYLVPDASDAAEYTLITTVPANKQQSFIAEAERKSKEEEMKNTRPQQPQTQMVYSYPQYAQQQQVTYQQPVMQQPQFSPVPVPQYQQQWAYVSYPGSYYPAAANNNFYRSY